MYCGHEIDELFLSPHLTGRDRNAIYSCTTNTQYETYKSCAKCKRRDQVEASLSRELAQNEPEEQFECVSFDESTHQQEISSCKRSETPPLSWSSGRQPCSVLSVSPIRSHEEWPFCHVVTRSIATWQREMCSCSADSF